MSDSHVHLSRHSATSTGFLPLSPSFSAASTIQSGVDSVGIKALVRQYKGDIDALARVRSGVPLPAAWSETRSETPEVEAAVEVVGRDKATKKGPPAAVSNTQHQEEAAVRWLDLTEETPVVALNSQHPAVTAGGAWRRETGRSAPTAEPLVSERLPPIPPSVSTRDKDGDAHALQSSQPRHQSAFALDCVEDAGGPQGDSGAALISSGRSVKSLRLPRTVLNAQLPSFQSNIGSTVFRSVNAHLESEATVELNAKIANGARLAKKIGATLASHVAQSNHSRHAHHHHNNNSQTSDQSNSKQQVSPNSARRALKASNILSTMSTAGGKVTGDSMLI